MLSAGGCEHPRLIPLQAAHHGAPERLLWTGMCASIEMTRGLLPPEKAMLMTSSC